MTVRAWRCRKRSFVFCGLRVRVDGRWLPVADGSHAICEYPVGGICAYTLTKTNELLQSFSFSNSQSRAILLFGAGIPHLG